MSGFPPSPPPPGGYPPQGQGPPPPPGGPPPPTGPPPPQWGYQPQGYPGQGSWIELAQFGDRLGGWAIDLIIGVGILIALWVMSLIIRIVLMGGMVLSLGASRAGPNDVLAIPSLLGGMSCSCCTFFLPHFTMLLFGLYNSVYLVGKRGVSIGQQAMKLRVVTAQGTLVPMGTLFIRLLIWILFTLLPVLWVLDLLWPLWDTQRQTLHDKAVNTFVLKIRGT